MKLSVIIPFYNERANLLPLLDELVQLGNSQPFEWECILVDDGSTDGYESELEGWLKEHSLPCRLLWIRLRRRFGKGGALWVGIEKAQGEWMATLDGDGQDVPSELFRLLEIGEREKAHMVLGWRKERQDPFSKILASKVYNSLLSRLFSFTFQDINTGLKVFRRQCVEELLLYGDFYRLWPVILAFQGFKVLEEPVVHRPRKYGRSKYSSMRYFTGLLDLWSLTLLLRFPTRPSHLFGCLGMVCTGAGFAILGYIAYLRLLYGTIFFHYPLLLLGILLFLTGIQTIFAGLLAELIAFYSRPSPPCSVEVVQIYEKDSSRHSSSS